MVTDDFLRLVDNSGELTDEEREQLRLVLLSGPVLKALRVVCVEDAASLSNELIKLNPLTDAALMLRIQGNVNRCLTVLSSLWELTKETENAA